MLCGADCCLRIGVPEPAEVTDADHVVRCSVGAIADTGHGRRSQFSLLPSFHPGLQCRSEIVTVDFPQVVDGVLDAGQDVMLSHHSVGQRGVVDEESDVIPAEVEVAPRVQDERMESLVDLPVHHDVRMFRMLFHRMAGKPLQQSVEGALGRHFVGQIAIAHSEGDERREVEVFLHPFIPLLCRVYGRQRIFHCQILSRSCSREYRLSSLDLDLKTLQQTIY